MLRSWTLRVGGVCAPGAVWLAESEDNPGDIMACLGIDEDAETVLARCQCQFRHAAALLVADKVPPAGIHANHRRPRLGRGVWW